MYNDEIDSIKHEISLDKYKHIPNTRYNIRTDIYLPEDEGVFNFSYTYYIID